MRRRIGGVTLLELLIALVLFSLLVLGFSSIDLFSRYHVISADRRAKLQNEVTFVFEHMTKEISKAIGDVNQLPVIITSFGSDPAIIIWIDYNQNGIRDSYPADRQIAYSLRGSPNYQLRYYANYSGSPASSVILSRKISSFTTSLTGNYYVNVNITARWFPGQPVSVDNPEVNMRTCIKMPSVSVN